MLVCTTSFHHVSYLLLLICWHLQTWPLSSAPHPLLEKAEEATAVFRPDPTLQTHDPPLYACHLSCSPSSYLPCSPDAHTPQLCSGSQSAKNRINFLIITFCCMSKTFLTREDCVSILHSEAKDSNHIQSCDGFFTNAPHPSSHALQKWRLPRQGGEGQLERSEWT